MPTFSLTANLKTKSSLFLIEEILMVYCSKCGTQNPDTNTVCSNCGAPLYTVGQRYPGSDREHYRRVENECFGLPNGGMIAGIVIGVIIILVGLGLFLQTAYGITINFWPFIIIIFGILILLGALYRQKRYSERPSNPP
jgi:hypothetical protein